MDLYRPIYHFMPPNNWMNDPNGLLFYEGEYHLFYQYNPNGEEWGTIHWGHAKSDDLVHWRHLPIALYPSVESGEEHCFSGSAVIDDDGVPTIFYTSIGSGKRDYVAGAEQWMATSADGMNTWVKSPRNPVLSKRHHGGLDIREWRDPYVWKQDGRWLMATGAQHNGKGCALIHGSDNLIEWRFLNKLMEAQHDAEYVWECPIFFELEGKYVLLYSPKDVVNYYTGTLNDDFTFSPDYHGTLDHSGWEGFYAPNTMKDDKGRRLMWGWMTEMSRGAFAGGRGWAGVQSVPRVLSLRDNGSLRIEPAPELRRLRGEEERMAGVVLENAERTLAIRGRALELLVEFEIMEIGASFGLKLLHSADGEEYTLLLFEPFRSRYAVDRAQSSLSPLPHRTELHCAMDKAVGDRVRLHLFLDHSLLETFVDAEHCISTRIYPTLATSDGVTLFARRGQVAIRSLQVWKLDSIWED